LGKVVTGRPTLKFGSGERQPKNRLETSQPKENGRPDPPRDTPGERDRKTNYPQRWGKSFKQVTSRATDVNRCCFSIYTATRPPPGSTRKRATVRIDFGNVKNGTANGAAMQPERCPEHRICLEPWMQSQSKAKQSNAKQCKAKARQTKQSKPKQSKAMQSTANPIQSDALKQCRTRRPSQAVFYNAALHGYEVYVLLPLTACAGCTILTTDVSSWRVLLGAGCTTLTADVSSWRVLNGSGCTTLTVHVAKADVDRQAKTCGPLAHIDKSDESKWLTKI